MDKIQLLIQKLENAKGDTQAQATLTTEFSLMSFPENERTRLHESLDAAAILHGFNADLLSNILEISQKDAELCLETLQTFPFVEQFRRGRQQFYNLHEATRLGWRKHLAQSNQNRFRDLSLRAANIFVVDTTPAGRIEWIYHLLCGHPEQAATELENLDREWSSQARPEDYDGLALALQELEATQLIADRARVWVLLVIASSRIKRGEAAQLAAVGHETLALARECHDRSAEAQANCLIGDIQQAQGQSELAKVAFNQYLSICQRLAGQDPGNAGWQRELAVAHNRVGGILQAQEQLELALAAFNQSLSIFQRLAEQDPSNAGWQRELAVAHSRVGGILQAQGKLEQAQAAYNHNLSTSQRLAELDPSNAGWQRELAVAHNRVGGILQAQEHLELALAAINQDLNISQRLAEQDPGNAGWQLDLAMTHSRVGDILQAQEHLEPAKTAFNQSLSIFRRLAEQDPGNAVWQRGLAVAHNRVGSILQAQEHLEPALAAFNQSLSICQRLAEQDPGNAVWQRDLINAQGWVDNIKAKLKSK